MEKCDFQLLEADYKFDHSNVDNANGDGDDGVEKCDFWLLETDNTFYHSNGDNGDDGDDDGDDNRTWLPWKNVIAIDWR